MHQDHIRNFVIIAHIDHGKSTLADRLLELTGTVEKRQMQEQILDSNPIERERGITIKLAPVRMSYQSSAFSYQTSESRKLIAESYILNLIDTPGHVDFSYEVSRSLAACEGAILVVDATQGVQAQTLAHLYQARSHHLTIIPIINKIDLPNARIEETKKQLESLEFREEEILKISAKTGENVGKVLVAIVERIPPPRGEPAEPLRALVFSSQYDMHKGVVVFIRVVDGQVGAYRGSPFAAPFDKTQGKHPVFTPSEVEGLEKTRRAAPHQFPRLKFLASSAEVTPIEIGYFSPKMTPCDMLSSGSVGYIATGLKDVRFAKVGDTITVSRIIANEARQSHKKNEIPTPSERSRDDKGTQVAPLSGYQEPKPMVFLGLFPVSADDYQTARKAMERLRLSDSAFSFRPISSLALGQGFHCGFLGLLHAEVVQERLLREFGLTMLATSPSVEYKVKLRYGVIPGLTRNPSSKSNAGSRLGGRDDNVMNIQSASEYPNPSFIGRVEEPIMKVDIFSPKQYVGAIMQLAQEKRGVFIDLRYLSGSTPNLVMLSYFIPLSEMIIDLFDRLKSASSGYASLDYEFFGYQPVELVKIDILVNEEKVDALSFLIVKSRAQKCGRELVERLATTIPRHQFSIPIQGVIGSPRLRSGEAGGQVIARADVKPFRKDVTKKLYGGDRTRKDKLLDKQKKGKARMKLVGKVEIPQSAFFQVLKRV